MENSIIMKKNKNLYLNSNSDLENVIIESLFINFKHTGAITLHKFLFRSK
jgi:hypothetical protein